MSPFLIQMFGFMSGSFILGLLLGWLIWKFRSADKRNLAVMTTERDFWQNHAKHDQTGSGHVELVAK